MRELIFKVCLLVTFLITSASFAQDLNKTSLLSDLNNTEGIELSKTEKSSFEKANNELVSNLIAMDKKERSKSERDKEIEHLFDQRDKNLSASLGLNKYSDIKSKTDLSIQQDKEKLKLTKL